MPSASTPEQRDGSDSATMAAVYAQYQSFVKRSVRRLGVTPADADDAVQQVFLVVHRRLDQYLGIRTKRGWLFSISRLVSNNYRRGLRRARAHTSDLVFEPVPDAEQLLAQLEARRLLDRFLDDLKEPERSAFYLSHFEGFTAPEIAKELSVNMNTVYTHLRNARLRAARLRFDRDAADQDWPRNATAPSASAD